MAVYCNCCGAEITEKAEACPVCKTPQHGMWPAEAADLPGIKTVFRDDEPES